MKRETRFNPDTIERLEEQSDLLLKMYETDFAKDPMSAATKSSRSNVIALRHTTKQIYGEAAVLAVDNPLDFADDAASSAG